MRWHAYVVLAQIVLPFLFRNCASLRRHGLVIGVRRSNRACTPRNRLRMRDQGRTAVGATRGNRDAITLLVLGAASTAGGIAAGLGLLLFILWVVLCARFTSCRVMKRCTASCSYRCRAA